MTRDQANHPGARNAQGTHRRGEGRWQQKGSHQTVSASTICLFLLFTVVMASELRIPKSHRNGSSMTGLAFPQLDLYASRLLLLNISIDLCI